MDLRESILDSAKVFHKGLRVRTTYRKTFPPQNFHDIRYVPHLSVILFTINKLHYAEYVHVWYQNTAEMLHLTEIFMY